MSSVKTQLVIFGITGDLSTRKLLPALESIVKADECGDLSVIGVSRRQVKPDQLLKDHPMLLDRTTIYTMDLVEPDDYMGLKAKLDEGVEEGKPRQVLFYLAVPPGAAATIVDLLGRAGLNSPEYKVLFEKPFGFDLASARDFIDRTARYFNDDQLFRIDHYMAKEIATEMLRMRADAEAKNRPWNNKLIDEITVVASEEIDIEGRASFYEQTGALRDFIQGHLMQVLALVLMPLYDPIDLPKQRLAALSGLAPADPAKAIRAQYKGYQQDVENPGSQTETFVSLELSSQDPNWEGVTIRLISGKALDKKRSYIHIRCKDGYEDQLDEDRLFERDSKHLKAYERVLIEAISGRKDIFTSSQEVIRSWEILAPVQQAWAMDDNPITQYQKGTSITSL